VQRHSATTPDTQFAEITAEDSTPGPTPCSSSDGRERWVGWLTAVSAATYLLLAVFVVIPWFRSGADPHYARYFGHLGTTPGELLRTAIAKPSLILDQWFSTRSVIYGLSLLLPLGFLPLCSISRLLVALPFFGMLSLLEFADGHNGGTSEYVVPFHHFHAPLVAIVFWAAASGMRNVARIPNAVAVRWQRLVPAHWSECWPRFVRHFVWTSSLATSLFMSVGPTGIPFWDSRSTWYWKTLYIPGERAKRFPQVIEQIPRTARVASTDFVHPRFTHHERSYDYSGYRRAVSGNQVGAPADTEYIVIDTQHPYSTIHTPDQIPEFREHPDQWTLLPDATGGYFVVLKRQ
jgi:uncharacterized membrane protein